MKHNRAAYSFKEFGELFGKSHTWTYRLSYAGKLKTIDGYGKRLVPASEVDRILNTAKDRDD
tara:strand:+ start:386 stop:571 length:186 start_codon:yes stop_codon:yes gene_type:complete